MEKVKKLIKGHQTYLLGKDADGIYHWLVAPSWDCGWYWGFGYVQAYSNNAHPEIARDIRSHQHFDGLFLLNRDVNAFDAFKEFFKETPLSDDEIWLLVDYMDSFYNLQKTSTIVGRGYSYYTSRSFLDEVKNGDMVNTINKIMLPAIFAKIDALLS